jgi:hypothetical protein
MVLISIHPFAIRKLFLIIAALLCFSAVCFADPVLMVRRYASSADRSDLARVSISTGDGWAGRGEPYFASFKPADLAARELEPASNDGGKTGLPAVPSSVFRNASCAMRPAANWLRSRVGAFFPERRYLAAL